MLRVEAFDHIVFNVSDVEASAAWYEKVLGMTRETAEPSSGGPTRVSMKFGRNKINLRPTSASQTEWFTARSPLAGIEALCFVTDTAPDAVAEYFRVCGVLIEQGPVTVIAAVIDKQRLVKRYSVPGNPYEIALTFCMERLQRWLSEKGQGDRLTHLMVEKRGAAEDAMLELEFRRIVDGQNQVGRMQNIDIRFMDKKHNSTGLQVADLFAHPIGRHVINPAQPNRAFEMLEPKFRRSTAGVVKGYGLKVFP